jgi:hypothetical protein
MYQLANDNVILLLVMVLWVLPWKGYSLWTAAKNNHKGWFVALIIVNTFGILEIIYIFAVAKKKWSDIKSTVFRIVSPKKK